MMGLAPKRELAPPPGMVPASKRAWIYVVQSVWGLNSLNMELQSSPIGLALGDPELSPPFYLRSFLRFCLTLSIQAHPSAPFSRS